VWYKKRGDAKNLSLGVDGTRGVIVLRRLSQSPIFLYRRSVTPAATQPEKTGIKRPLQEKPQRYL